MPAFIFLCDMTTERECLDRKLFGTNPGEQHQHHYSKIATGHTLFLYNIDLGTLRGPYLATTTCQMNIEPTAWKSSKRKFPWQVRVDDSGVGSKPLGVEVVRKVIPLAITKAGLLPPAELTDEQTQKLLDELASLNR